MNVKPSTSFEAVLDEGSTGLAGTIRLSLIDNIGGTTIAASSASITERAFGIYAAVRTAPGTEGQYTLVWDDGTANGIIGIEDLVVTLEDAVATIGSGNLYVTREQLKTILGRSNESYADDAIDLACSAASRMIDGYKDTRFYPTAEVRFYSADPFSSRIDIDDLVTLNSVQVDRDNDGIYEVTLVEGDDFLLDPPNAALQGRPSRSIALRTGIDLLPYGADTLPTLVPHVRFPTYQRGIRVDGTFGWATAPVQVTQAAVFLANRFVTRIGQAPLAVIVKTTAEAVATARLGVLDPDVKELLDDIPGATRRLFA